MLNSSTASFLCHSMFRFRFCCRVVGVGSVVFSLLAGSAFCCFELHVFWSYCDATWCFCYEYDERLFRSFRGRYEYLALDSSFVSESSISFWCWLVHAWFSVWLLVSWTIDVVTTKWLVYFHSLRTCKMYRLLNCSNNCKCS